MVLFFRCIEVITSVTFHSEYLAKLINSAVTQSLFLFILSAILIKFVITPVLVVEQKTLQ